MEQRRNLHYRFKGSFLPTISLPPSSNTLLHTSLAFFCPFGTNSFTNMSILVCSHSNTFFFSLVSLFCLWSNQVVLQWLSKSIPLEGLVFSSHCLSERRTCFHSSDLAILLPHWLCLYLIFLFICSFGGADCPLFLRSVSLWTLLVLLPCLSKGTFSPTWHRFVICTFAVSLGMFFALMALATVLVLAVFLLLCSCVLGLH